MKILKLVKIENIVKKKIANCDKKCLIWVFSGQIFKKSLSYYKYTPSNLSNCKLWQKNKNA